MGKETEELNDLLKEIEDIENEEKKYKQIKNQTEEKIKNIIINIRELRKQIKAEGKELNISGGSSDDFKQLLNKVTKFTSKKNKIKIIKLLKAVVKKLKQKLNINMMMFPFFGFMGGNKDLDKMTDTELNNKGMKLIDEIKDIAIKYKNIIDKFPWFKKVLNMF